MSTRVHISDEWERDGVGIAILREHGGRREVLQWPMISVQIRDADDTYRSEQEEDRLHLRTDDARALYEALADHFGHSGHDTRALRRDYEAERGRVDKFIAHMTRGGDA